MAERPQRNAVFLILLLLSWISSLQQRIRDLEGRLGEDSSTSNRPPSADPPYKRPERKNSGPSGRKRGGQPGHQGRRQKLLEPTEERHILPEKCKCGPALSFLSAGFLLHRGRCTKCGKETKARVPSGHSTGYGPRLSGLIALLSGDHGDSRETVQRFCRQFLGLHISMGAVQKVINRASQAIRPHYEAIRDQVYQSRVNHVDETPWYQARGALQWLWVMGNSAAAFFMVHTNRTKKAFNPAPTSRKWVQGLPSHSQGQGFGPTQGPRDRQMRGPGTQ